MAWFNRTKSTPTPAQSPNQVFEQIEGSEQKGSKVARTAIMLAVGAALGIGGGAWAYTELAPDTTVYKLTQNVPARVIITEDMLTPIPAHSNTLSGNEITPADLHDKVFVAKHNLVENDVVRESDIGGYEDIAVGVPDTHSVFSISVPASKAAGGRIQRGTYFDMMVTLPNGTIYPYYNFLALDTSVSADGLSNAEAIDTEEAKAGQTTDYTISAIPPEAARIIDLMAKHGGSVSLALSPRKNVYAQPNIEDYKGVFNPFTDEVATSAIGPDGREMPLRDPLNAGIGTDATFTPKERDQFGRPLPEAPSCAQGNVKLPPEVCAQAGKSAPDPSPSQSASPTPASEPEAQTTTGQ